MKFKLSGILLTIINRFKAVVIIIALALTSQSIAAQSEYNISGTIKDEQNKELPSVTVFLSGRTNITASNEKGIFTLYNLAPGSYLLIARSVGYKTYAKEITITATDVKVSVKLKQQLNTLQEVIVSGFSQKYFDKFSRYFLGTTPNSKKCTILNRDALHFYFDKETQTLSVSADDLLQIQNDALGYKISYSLESFELNEEKHLLKYQGYPSFHELQPPNKTMRKHWKQDREIAYNGSITNFLRSLYNDDLDNQGFEVYQLANKVKQGETTDGGSLRVIQRVLREDSLTSRINKNSKKFSFKNSLLIVYRSENVNSNFASSEYYIDVNPRKLRYISQGQNSMVTFLSDNIVIDKHGYYTPQGGLLFEGYMAWEQVADLLPLEFGD